MFNAHLLYQFDVFEFDEFFEVSVDLKDSNEN